MGLLDMIKSVLGLGKSDERRGTDDVGVTVERDTRDADEPRTGSEEAVKAPADEAADDDSEEAEEDEEAVAASTDAAASTGSMVDDDPDTVAEPAEAVGVGDGDDEVGEAEAEETAVDTEPPETNGAAASGSDAAASTGSMVDENVAAEAAEPAEAADVAADTGAAVEEDEELDAEADDADDATAEPEADAVEADDEDDIPEDDKADEDGAESTESPEVLKGIGPAYARRLADAGIETVGELAAADADAVADDIDVSPKRVARWVDRAKEY